MNICGKDDHKYGPVSFLMKLITECVLTTISQLVPHVLQDMKSPWFCWVHVSYHLGFYVVFCKPLFVFRSLTICCHVRFFRLMNCNCPFLYPTPMFLFSFSFLIADWYVLAIHIFRSYKQFNGWPSAYLIVTIDGLHMFYFLFFLHEWH